MVRKLLIAALVLGCSVPSSGCLVIAGAAVVAAKKKHDHKKACEAVAAGQPVDPEKAPKNCDEG
ncbi:MAG TPA: hypothetical protein VF559_06790 [Caulobacteraceae bacterium]|jgi:hypothetical protein